MPSKRRTKPAISTHNHDNVTQDHALTDVTPLDRTGTEPSAARYYLWLPVLTTVAILATVLVLAFTGNTAVAVAVAAAGVAAGGIQITVHIRR